MATAIYTIGFLLLGGAAAWTVDIAPEITLNMSQVISVPFSIHNLRSLPEPCCELWSWNTKTDEHIARARILEITKLNETVTGILNITGVFLGWTKLTFTVSNSPVSEHLNLITLFWRIIKTSLFFFRTYF